MTAWHSYGDAARQKLSEVVPQFLAGTPAAAQNSTSRMQNVPYCPGGRRDKGCLFGTDCRITSEGCQVCQCEGLDD